MTKEQAHIEIERLKAELWENSRLYYVENAPVISDYDYDQMLKRLEALEDMYPEFRTPDSPSQKVGSDIRKEFVQYPHRYPMLSLQNTYSIGEVEDFAARAQKTLEEGFSYSCELKFDGTSISLNYRNGVLVRALTRGDGVVGDDVTSNARRITNIPLRLKGEGWPDDFEIRGEILMPYTSFDRLNEERADAGEEPFANPRNAASGSLKLLDSAEAGRRGLICTLYHIPGEHGFTSHSQALDAAASWGLPVSDKRKICHSIAEIEEYINYWDTERHTLPFATDGCVIKINELSAQKALGFTSKFPRWAVAYKFKAESVLTELLSIDYQVGRTGAVTPVANLAPVLLSGTTVKRATLNNADQMALLDIRIGDWVYVEKGGEIIPKITGIEESKRSPGSTTVPRFPEVCPDCGTPLVRRENEAKWFCPNEDGCPTQIKGKIVHFLGRKAMNVIAGDATVDQLYAMGFVRTAADLYTLSSEQLLQLDGWKERSVLRFLDSLRESAESTPFEKVLFALGIRYVGETTAKQLARHFGDIDTLAAASEEELRDVADIGDVIARSVSEWFRTPAHIDEIARLKMAGLHFKVDAKEGGSDILQGRTIVISGNFSISRESLKELIERYGGRNSGSVSSKTTYLLAGEKAGPEKLRKAAQLGVEVIDEARFMSMLPEGSAPQAQASKEEDLLLF